MCENILLGIYKSEQKICEEVCLFMFVNQYLRDAMPIHKLITSV